MEAATVERHSRNGATEVWDGRTRVFLTPIAPPSILGLFGFAAATFIVAAHLAGWYGSTDTPLYLAPFCAMFGGVAQFAAGMFAYRARDGLATAMHGMWGSFWIAFGILNILKAGNCFLFPALAMRSMQRVSLARSREFVVAGALSLAIAAVLAYGLVTST